MKFDFIDRFCLRLSVVERQVKMQMFYANLHVQAR